MPSATKNATPRAKSVDPTVNRGKQVTAATEQRPTATVVLSHTQIQDRAEALWLSKGCPGNQDEKMWLEAEAQLKAEYGLT